MSRFIIIFLLITVVVIFATTYIVGALRRMFIGNVAGRQSKPNQTPKDEILYEKDNIKVLKGDAKKNESRST